MRDLAGVRDCSEGQGLRGRERVALLPVVEGCEHRVSEHALQCAPREATAWQAQDAARAQSRAAGPRVRLVVQEGDVS